MSDRRIAFLTAAGSALELLSRPEVAQGWEGPSALQDFTVGGLAAHLASQAQAVAAALESPASTLECISVLEHYNRALWAQQGADGEVNVTIRGRGEQAAQGGAQVVLDGAADTLGLLEVSLPAADLGKPVRVMSGDWALSLDGLLLTRLMEIAVHSDDLAVSLGLATPDLPAEVIEPVLGLLATVAARKHGQAALLRALTRSERAPASITAF